MNDTNPLAQDEALAPLDNHDGWVNPEDIASMPQCIAQQQQSHWLDAMGSCTSKRCTKHLFICMRQEWLTQLSCLGAKLPEVILHYLPYCSRSILAKAQLYRWVHQMTGQTWLVDPGDADGLAFLTPSSLARGYSSMSTTDLAPTCLARPMGDEGRWDDALLSCGFTGTTEHLGDGTHPWEYHDGLQSMVSLDVETAGYDLTGHYLQHGHYFDKACFCSTFTVDPGREPCTEYAEMIDQTQERLWIKATCGSASLPDHWTDGLLIAGPAYIPTADWSWPLCRPDMPQSVVDRVDQCEASVCELDSRGYCSRVKHAVDRTCFCRNIDYDSCGGACHFFETRFEYVQWLHGLCGDVEDWHGLPDNWHSLTLPSRSDMIPWQWTVQSPIAEESSPTGTQNFWGLVCMNVAPVLLVLLLRWLKHKKCFSVKLDSSWFFKGIFIAGLQLLANGISAFLVSKITDYDVPAGQLVLLWCTLPLPGWLSILPIAMQPFSEINFYAAASSLLAEILLQLFSSYYMLITFIYGLKHDVYFGSLQNANKASSAQIMYNGAFIWAATIGISVVCLSRAVAMMVHRMECQKFHEPDTPSTIFNQLSDHFVSLWKEATRSYAYEGSTPLLASMAYSGYGAVPIVAKGVPVSQIAFVELYALIATSMLLLWVAQWLFWGGFIGLSSETFCPPMPRLLMAVWIVFSAMSMKIRESL